MLIVLFTTANWYPADNVQHSSATSVVNIAVLVLLLIVSAISGVDPLVFWVFEHPHNFGRWCSPVSEHPRFFLIICAFYQQMVCTCKVYIC